MAGEPLLPIIAEIAVAAPIGHVWETLTSAEAVPVWLGCLNYKAEVGATFHMQPDAGRGSVGDLTGATHCEILLLQPPHKFNFSWYVPGTPQTLVQVSVFSEGPEKSFVRLGHSGWEQFRPEDVRAVHDQLAAAWRWAVLPGLKAAAEAR
jgi:uncharacterized protein YndB with AHSA1/START domain